VYVYAYGYTCIYEMSIYLEVEAMRLSLLAIVSFTGEEERHV